VTLYDVVDQLFAKADPDSDSVKTIAQLVADHFNLPKVAECTKKTIKTRLQYLMESQDKLHTGGTEKGSKKASPTDLRRVGNGGSADRGTAENEKEQNGKQDDERDSDNREEFDQKRCLQCKKKYTMDTNSTVTKYISYKCNHHFCQQCIADWRVGWDDNSNTRTRRNDSQEYNITTLECPHPTCTMQHDKFEGSFWQGKRQSFEKDIIAMSQLREDYISSIDNKKKSMKTLMKKRHPNSLTCG